jgi:hypothetical protein
MRKIIFTIELLIGIVTCYNASAQDFDTSETKSANVEVLTEKTASGCLVYNK